MLNTLYSVLEDSMRPIDATAQFYSGSPVALIAGDTTNLGTITVATDTMRVYGLAKFDANNYVNFAKETSGAYGSGELTVVRSGIVQLYPSIYQDPTSLTTVIVQIWDNTQTYLVGDALGVNSSKQITNSGITNSSTSFLGRVITGPSVTNGGVMTIDLKTL